MDVLTIIGIAATVVGIIAGIVQVVQYWQERHKKLDTPAEEAPAAPTPVVAQIPHNLPPRSEFIGREAEKARVHEGLLSRLRLVSIDGIGGIGKTVLALEVAHECLQASKEAGSTDGIAIFEGFTWTTAKDRELTLDALLDAIARTLDYPGIAQQPMKEKQTEVLKLLQKKPYLLIVDNFETITDEGVRDFLTKLPEPSKALITTREQKLRRPWAISLKRLTDLEALALIRSDGKRLGLASLERAEDRVLLNLYQATGGAPLAIKWAVGQIKQRGQSLDTVRAALHEARGDIFSNMFSRSWGLLSGEARKVLIVMPLFATSASREGIEAASHIHGFALDEALGQLVEMSLVDATDEFHRARRRYSIHPLTRAFAAAKLSQEPETRRAGQQRLNSFYHSFTREHGGFWYQDGFAQLDSELPNILATARWCQREQVTEMGFDILHNILGFILIHSYWSDVLKTCPPTDFVVYQIERMGCSLSSPERDLLERACEVAVSVYGHRVRRSGDPYISHCIAVGLIAAAAMRRHRIDIVVVAAALNHDVWHIVGPGALAQVGKALGPEVQTLVREVSRLGKAIAAQELDQLASLFTRPAILISLADRLHNMQTIRFTPQDGWQRHVEKTENVFIPLAQETHYLDIVRELERTTQETKLCLETTA